MARSFDNAITRFTLNYFNPHAIYDKTDLERRFRMPRVVSDRVRDELMGRSIFDLRSDVTNKEGICSLIR